MAQQRGRMKPNERKAKERERWHRRMADTEFREREKVRSIERRKKYMSNPEFRARWNAWRRKRYKELRYGGEE